MEKKDHSKELDKILSEQEVTSEKTQEKVAFSNNESFKNAIGNEEFSSVITLLTNIVEKISDSLENRESAKQAAITKLKEMKETFGDNDQMSVGIKIVKRKLMETDVKVYETFSNEFENLTNTIEFLNRFRPVDDMIPYVNLSWVGKVKKYLNNKKNK
jgi:hypothetical protein